MTIVTWPPGLDREAFAQMLGAAGLDEPTARLRLGLDPPMVLGPARLAPSSRAVEAVVRAGGDAFAFTTTDLEKLGPALRARGVTVADGAFHLALHEGPTAIVPFGRVQVLVRAQTREETVTDAKAPRMTSVTRRSYATRRAEVDASRKRVLTTTEHLDLHTTDGGLFRLGGRGFDYGLLGDLKAHGAKANLDHLLEILSHFATDAVVDTYFKLWRPPAAHVRLRVPGPAADPSFEFYSRWAALTYRHVMGA